MQFSTRARHKWASLLSALSSRSWGAKRSLLSRLRTGGIRYLRSTSWSYSCWVNLKPERTTPVMPAVGVLCQSIRHSIVTLLENVFHYPVVKYTVHVVRVHSATHRCHSSFSFLINSHPANLIDFKVLRIVHFHKVRIS